MTQFETHSNYWEYVDVTGYEQCNNNYDYVGDYARPSATPYPKYRYGFDDPFANEPPLLDELEIYPMRIIEKSLAILNPFHVETEDESELLDDADLAGPVVFGLTLAFARTLSGGEPRFGYIYGLSVLAVFAMFFLVQLLNESAATRRKSGKRQPSKPVSIGDVASLLGYCLQPIVWLAVLGIVVTLKSLAGAVLGAAAVAMATRGASAQLCRLTGDPKQRLMLAYPCGMVYGVFMLLVLF